MTDPTPVAVAPPPVGARDASDAAVRPVSAGYRRWVLFLLLLVYVSNFADRQILGALQPLIQADLQLTDAQFGVLHGIAFALFYVTVGLPIAWLAERFNRVTIIAVSTVVWSLMTGVSGFASNFWQMAVARFGVGVGEAGSGPASNSLLTDYYPPEKRASVIGIFSLGIPIGGLVGALGGAIIGFEYGWRTAFFVLGLPGVLLAILVWLTIREPRRGGLDPVGTSLEAAPFMAVVRRLFSKPSLVHLGVAASLSSLAGYGTAAFAISLLVRRGGDYELDLRAAATAYALIGCVASAAGTALGGIVTDRFGKRDDRWRVWIPSGAFLIAGPLYAIGFQQPTVLLLSLCVIPPIVLQYLYLGPVFGLLHNMVEPRMRATAVAIINFFINLIGLGLGPTLVGLLSTWLAARFYEGASFTNDCPAGLPPTDGPAAIQAACGAASFDGLQWAMSLVSLVFVWGALHFFLAGRTLRRDLAT